MIHKKIEVKLETNKSREQLWNKINSPEKLIKIENLSSETIITKISDNNYELKSNKYHILVTFIPETAVNQIYIYETYSLLTWFEIKGEYNCIIAHGEFKPLSGNLSEKKLNLEIKELKQHFIEELEFIVK